MPSSPNMPSSRPLHPPQPRKPLTNPANKTLKGCVAVPVTWAWTHYKRGMVMPLVKKVLQLDEENAPPVEILDTFPIGGFWTGINIEIQIAGVETKKIAELEHLMGIYLATAQKRFGRGLLTLDGALR